MKNELERLRHDLETMEHVIKRGPDFDRRHVWISIGWGIWGVIFISFGFIPRVVPPLLLAGVLIVLLFAMPHFLPRLACRDLPSEPPPGDKEVNSISGAILLVGLSLGTVFWVSRMAHAPNNLVLALLLLLVALWALFVSWGRRWWRGLLAFAVAFGAAGLAMPFLSRGMIGPAIGAAMILSGFGGAAILHWQLKSYYDHEGKIAH